MTFHLRIPGLVDIGVVDRAPLVFEVDAKPRVGRELHGASSGLGGFLTGRLRNKLRVGNTPLPTFADRDAVGRQPLLDALERHFEAVDFEAHTFRGDVARLAADERHQAGREAARLVRVVGQRPREQQRDHLDQGCRHDGRPGQREDDGQVDDDQRQDGR